MEPVRTLCDLGNTVESTTTQINNTQYADRPVLTSTGVNSVELNYAASITQMRELVMNSQYCEQLIKYTCKGTPMFQSPEGPPKVVILCFTIIICITYFHWNTFSANTFSVFPFCCPFYLYS